MSSGDDLGGIKFTWKIENFRYCTKCIRNVQSPSFGLNSLKWNITIDIKNEEISLKLCHLIGKAYNLNCLVEVLNCNGIPMIWLQKRNVSSRSYMDDFKFSVSEFLPNDTLTIQCRLCRTAEDLTTTVSLFARTLIQNFSVKKTFTLDVVNVRSLQPSQPLEHSEAITDGESFTIKLTLNYDDNFHVQLTTSLIKVNCNIKIYWSKALKNKLIVNHFCEFNKQTKICYINTNIAKTMLLCYPNHFLPSDMLSLQFICTFTGDETFNRMVDEREFLANIPRNAVAFRDISEASVCGDELAINQTTADPSNTITHSPKPPNTVAQALQEVFNEGFLSDFNLRVGDNVFPVHKVILGMRSQVFRAMFTSEMKEKDDNFVDIQDVDEDSLQRLLQFVYSDMFDESMGWESALNLYAAADKYALESLKQECSTTLKSGLSVSSVLEVLSLADMHQDQDLKSAALEFISSNDQEIVDTERWVKFEEENGKLALDTFRNLYKKKMNA